MAMLLDGIRVIDWTVYHHGGVAGCTLADMGAEVIKLEALGTGDVSRGMRTISGVSFDLPDGRSGYFEITNRNKKSIAVDLSKPEGKEIVYRLAERSDVFLHNFRGKAADKLGMSYEALRKRNPKLVYAAGSGFGSRGPDANIAAFDNTGCARSGIHDALNDLASEEPCNPPTAVGDHSGATMLAFGVITALFARERLGIGQKVESSLLSSTMWLQGLDINTYLLRGTQVARLRHDTMTNPLLNSYRCRDGKWMYLVLSQYDRFWPDFCQAVGRPDLRHDPRFANAEAAAENHRALIVELEHVFATCTAAEWTEVFRAYPDFVYQTVNTVADLADDPQVQANNYITDYPHPTLGSIKAVRVPLHFSETPVAIRAAAPECGQHTEEVLTEICGYSWDEIVAFREAGAI